MPNIFLVSLSILTVKFSNRCCLWRRHTFGLKKIFTLQGVRNERNCHVKWLLKVTAWEKLLFPHSGLQLNKTLLFLNVSFKKRQEKKKKSSGTFLLWIRTLMFVYFVYRLLIRPSKKMSIHFFVRPYSLCCHPCPWVKQPLLCLSCQARVNWWLLCC